MRFTRLLRSWDITWRRVTNKSQNTRHASVIMSDFRAYVKHRSGMLGVDPRDIYNCDETNVYNSMEATHTYAAKGSKTVSIKGCDSSNRVSVMLAAGWLGDKLPPYIVYMGSSGRTGRIRQELIRKVGYPV
jgi:hypothetical protein